MVSPSTRSYTTHTILFVNSVLMGPFQISLMVELFTEVGAVIIVVEKPRVGGNSIYI